MVEVVPSGTGRQGSEAASDSEGTVAVADTDTLTATGGHNPFVYACLGVGALALGALLARRLTGS